ncbi:LOW QUALITY PROTEIN: spectrin beta chain, non-erythrocytic 5 [Molossus nigricans]
MRADRVLIQLQDTEELQTQHPQLVANLLCRTAEKPVRLEAQDFPDSLPAAQQLLVALASFRTRKPPQLQQWASEILLFRLQTALRAQNTGPSASEGLRPVELSQRWAGRERAEASQSRLQQGLLQLERLETLAQGFQRKAALRENYLTDREQVLGQGSPPTSSATLEVAAQTGMLEAGILPQEGRFQALAEVVDVFQQEQYHSWADVSCRRAPGVGSRLVCLKTSTDTNVGKVNEWELRQLEVTRRWEQLLQRLHGQRKVAGTRLSGACASLLQEVESASNQLKELQVLASSRACGQQLAEVAELLQRQDLLEAQVSMHGDHVRPLAHQTTELNSSGTGAEVLQAKARELTRLHQPGAFSDPCCLRRALLEPTLQTEFPHACEEEEARLVEDAALGQDLGHIAATLQKHKVPATLSLEAELRSHQAVCADLQRRRGDLGARWLLTRQDPSSGLSSAGRAAAAPCPGGIAGSASAGSPAPPAAMSVYPQSCSSGSHISGGGLAEQVTPHLAPGRALQPVHQTGPGSWQLTDREGCPTRVPTSHVMEQEHQMVLPAEPDTDFDPNTILWTQDRLSQDSPQGPAGGGSGSGFYAPVSPDQADNLGVMWLKWEKPGPTESQVLQEQVGGLQELLGQMPQQVAQQAQARQSFQQESQRLLLWAGAQAQLAEEVVGVASAQQLLERDLLEEIHARQESCACGLHPTERAPPLIAVGSLWLAVALQSSTHSVCGAAPARVLAGHRQQRGQPEQDAAAGGSGPAHGSGGPPRGDSALRLPGQQSRGLKAPWEQRQQRRQEGLELQKSGQEADGFSSKCAHHEAFLRLDSLGAWPQVSAPAGGCGEARSLHQESGWLLGTLGLQAEALWARGKKLTQSQHPAAHKVREQLQSVQAQWTSVQESGQRRRQLLASLQLQGWKQNVAELMLWMEEKGLMVVDEPSREPGNLLRNSKHEAAERELLATQGHVEGLRRVGTKLLSSGPHAQEGVPARLRGLIKWEELNRKMAERGNSSAGQAAGPAPGAAAGHKERGQRKGLRSAETGRPCAPAGAAETAPPPGGESQALACEVTALVSQAPRVARSQPIRRRPNGASRGNSPACFVFTFTLRTSRWLLQDLSYRPWSLYQFCHLSSAELTWAAAHMPSAGPTRCLDDAQSLRHKHETPGGGESPQGQVLQGLRSGRKLAASWHPQGQPVDQCQELEGRWAELEQVCEAQAQGLQQASASWQYFLVASGLEDRVEEWPLVSSQDYGGDEAATTKLVGKHQALRPELALCRSAMEKPDRRAHVLRDPRPRAAAGVQKRLWARLRACRTGPPRAGGTVPSGYPNRDPKLEGTLTLHEFMRERELQGWLAGRAQERAWEKNNLLSKMPRKGCEPRRTGGSPCFRPGSRSGEAAGHTPGAALPQKEWPPGQVLPAQEQASLKTSALGSSVEEMEQLIRKHETFQNEMLCPILPSGPGVSYLSGTCLGTEAASASWGDVSTPPGGGLAPGKGSATGRAALKDKLRHLQKHQAFQAEVQAREEAIVSATESLSGRRGLQGLQEGRRGLQGLQALQEGRRGLQGLQALQEGRRGLQGLQALQEGRRGLQGLQALQGGRRGLQGLQALQKLWEKLRQAVAQGQELEDTRTCWSSCTERTFEVMVDTGDLGQDREHCLQLLKQVRELRGVRARGSVDGIYIRSINDLSLHLKNRDPEQVKTICQWQHQLNSRPVPRWEGGAGEEAGGPPPTQPRILSARVAQFPWQPALVRTAAFAPGRAVHAGPHKGMRGNRLWIWKHLTWKQPAPEETPTQVSPQNLPPSQKEGASGQGGAPLQPHGGPWEGIRLGACFLPRNPAASDPSAVGEGLEKGQAAISPSAQASLVRALGCAQRLLWKHEKLEQEMGLIQAQVEARESLDAWAQRLRAEMDARSPAEAWRMLEEHRGRKDPLADAETLLDWDLEAQAGRISALGATAHSGLDTPRPSALAQCQALVLRDAWLWAKGSCGWACVGKGHPALPFLPFCLLAPAPQPFPKAAVGCQGPTTPALQQAGPLQMPSSTWTFG